MSSYQFLGASPPIFTWLDSKSDDYLFYNKIGNNFYDRKILWQITLHLDCCSTHNCVFTLCSWYLLINGLLNCMLNCIVSNGWISSEQSTGKNLEGGSSGLIWGSMLALTFNDWENHNTFRIAGILAKSEVPSKSQKFCHLSELTSTFLP